MSDPNTDVPSLESGTTIAMPQGERTDLGDVKVGCLGVSNDTFTTADGTEREGLTGSLSIPGQDGFIVVGKDSEFEAGGAKWRVLSVTEGPDLVNVQQVTK